MPLETSPVVDRFLACAIGIHRALGPGLLESVYQRCLAHVLRRDGVDFLQQVAIPVVLDDLRIECGYRADFVVEQSVLVEIKSVERLLPIHSAQTLTYLKLSGLPRALLINFNVELLRNGVKSFVRSPRWSKATVSPDEKLQETE